jgi:hypothetical protein
MGLYSISAFLTRKYRIAGLLKDYIISFIFITIELRLIQSDTAAGRAAFAFAIE